MALLEDLPYELWATIIKELDPLSAFHFAHSCAQAYAVLRELPQKRRYDELARKIGHEKMGLYQAKAAFDRRSLEAESKEKLDARLELSISRLRPCITGEAPRHGKGFLLGYLKNPNEVVDFYAIVSTCESYIKLVDWLPRGSGKESVPSGARKRFLIAPVAFRTTNEAVRPSVYHYEEVVAQLAKEYGIWTSEGFKYLIYAYPSWEAAYVGFCRFMTGGSAHDKWKRYFCPSASPMKATN